MVRQVGGVQPRSCALPTCLIPKPRPGTSSLPPCCLRLLCSHLLPFHTQEQGKQTIAHPRTWGEAGGWRRRGKRRIRTLPKQVLESKTCSLSPELKWSPRGCHVLPRFLGWCHLPAVRETSESVLIPPSLSLSFSTSSWSPKAARLVRER